LVSMMTHDRVPDIVPVLSRGKHRNPRKGSCFMEFASYLAGERWSDHPDCTHPLLAALARDVNDNIGDEARRDIAPLVPDVIGLRWRDPVIDVLLARKAALAALPIAAAERQRVAAVGLLRCEQLLNEIDERPRHHRSDEVEAALAEVPDARDWALQFCDDDRGRFEFLGRARRSVDTFCEHSAPTIVHAAVVGIAEAAVDDAECRLVELLRGSIADCATWVRERVDDDASVDAGPSTPRAAAGTGAPAGSRPIRQRPQTRRA
jgi:hypothetical protein